MSIARAYGGVNPLTGRPFDEKEPTATARVHDITKADAYQQMVARERAAQAAGTAAEQRRTQATEALRALKNAPASAYTPIAVSVPSFSLGEDW